MFWVVLTLLMVGATPFLLSWYQINESKQAIIDQAQKNHLIISRATADRMSAYIEKYQDMAENLGNNASVYLEPDSLAAGQAVKNTLIAQHDVQLIALMLVNDQQQGTVIQLAQKSELAGYLLPLSQQKTPQLITRPNSKLMQISVPSARPQVDVVMLVKVNIQQLLDPAVLGQTANIALYNQQGKLLEHAGNKVASIPQEWLTLFQTATVMGGANRAQQAADQVIAAFAKLNTVPWFIVSEQPVKFAEQSASDMKKTAWQIFGLVLLVMSGLIVLAYLSWVKPIRRIVKAQNILMGEQTNSAMWEGGEMAALEHSFEALTKHINDRNALGKIFVDRYQVISPIGKGGMGSVFLGWDPKLKRHVALKTLPIGNNTGFGSRENMSETLVQEAITAAKISHRNVVSIYDVVSTGSTAFIAMEYIKGESLFNLLQRQHALTLSLTLAIAVAVLRGLHSAHKLGFVHRDVKPANILLDVNGDIKLTDFGTTALMNSLTEDSITGTAAYMAPETHQTGLVSEQSDIYAVGVVIVECLFGHNPFKGKKLSQTQYNVINKKITFPKELVQTGSAALFQSISLMLSKNPKKRPASAADAAQMLVSNMPGQIHWDAKTAGVKVYKNENNHESENTLIAHT